MSRKRLGAIDPESVRSSRSAAEEVVADRRNRTGIITPPIAHLARDAARSIEEELLRIRQENDSLRADGEAYARAEAEGLLIRALPLGVIDTRALPRDRRTIDRSGEEWQALRTSIEAHGQQAPIVVQPAENGRHGLISGYRRWSVLKDLHEETGEARFGTVLAIVADKRDPVERMSAMIEENEIRHDLSFYERGRVCCLAAREGFFDTAEEAVDRLFASSSRNRRYKIRNFVVIHQHLEGLLDFPEAIGERLGARLAQALKAGQGEALLAHLGARGTRFADAAEELALLDAFVANRPPFSERPKISPLAAETRTQTGLSLRAEARPDRVTLTLRGVVIEDAEELRLLLDRIAMALTEI